MIILDFHIETFLIVYVFLLLVAFIFYKKTRKCQNYHILYYMFIIFYYQLLFKVTILPIILVKDHSQLEMYRKLIGNGVEILQPVPFKTIWECFSSTAGLIQIFGNLILLMPLVYIMNFLSYKSYSTKKIIFIATCVSIGIEFSQFLISQLTIDPTHVVDIDDIILNVFGTIIAVRVFNLLKKYKKNFVDKLRYSMIQKN